MASRKRIFRGDRLRDARLKADFTQDELAERLGLGQSQMNKYETGKSDPSAEIMTRLASELNVSVDWLLGIARDPTPYTQLTTREIEEARLSSVFAELDSEGREALISYARFLRQQRVGEST